MAINQLSYMVCHMLVGSLQSCKEFLLLEIVSLRRPKYYKNLRNLREDASSQCFPCTGNQVDKKSSSWRDDTKLIGDGPAIEQIKPTIGRNELQLHEEVRRRSCLFS